MSTPHDADPDVVVRRTIHAPREELFDAWLDPGRLAQFMRPGDVTHANAEVDARVGGKFRIVMEHGRGNAEHWGEYVRIDRPSLLEFTWISGSTDHRPTLVTIEFHARGPATEVILRHRRLPERSRDTHRNGWGAILRTLDESIAPREGEARSEGST